jgi:SHS2 domain-containing protein
VVRYRQLEHTADVKVEVFGRDRAELFANAAFCVADLMVESGLVEAAESMPVSLKSTDERELLMDWLRELLFLFSNKGFVATRAEVLAVDEKSVSAVLHGEPYSLQKHGLKVELKTPTYHEYSLEHGDAGWRAVVVFDA